MSCRAAATLTSYGDEKALSSAVSKVRSSGCVRWGRVKSGSSRKKKWKHARLQGAQRREGVCLGLGCRGPECDFTDFRGGRFGPLGGFGNGAPPHARIHLNIQIYPPGSPPTKFGSYVTVCNRHLHPMAHLMEASPPVIRTTTRLQHLSSSEPVHRMFMYKTKKEFARLLSFYTTHSEV